MAFALTLYLSDSHFCVFGCVYRHAVFNTNKGRTLSWGFPNVAGATKAVAEAPVPGAYVAAIRGFEGKPAPVSKKR
jgi:hypothetical protein